MIFPFMLVFFVYGNLGASFVEVIRSGHFPAKSAQTGHREKWEQHWAGVSESMFQMFQVLESMCIHQLYLFPPNPGFAHTQTTHPNNMTYLSPEDE